MGTPKKTYVLVDSTGRSCFANASFERVVERCAALLKGQLDVSNPRMYRIDEVEGE